MRRIYLTIFSIALSVLTFGLHAQESESDELVRQGKKYYQQRNIEKAMQKLNEAIELNAQNDQAYFWRALAKEKQNDLAGANEDYQKAIEINPRPVYYNNWGMNLAVDGFYREAIEIYDKALEQNDEYAQAILNKGVAMHYIGEWDKACELARKAHDLGLGAAGKYLVEHCK